MSQKPCAFYQIKNGKLIFAKARVDCRENCAQCGFNPDEAKRRFREGTWTSDGSGIRTLNFQRRESADEQQSKR